MSKRFLRQLTAGLAVVAVAEAKAVVSFEFKDVGTGGDNEIEVRQGGVFSFDVWLHADGAHVNTVSFKLNFPEYNFPPPGVSPNSFTIHSEPVYTDSDFTGTAFSVTGERLVPDNLRDLGGFLGDFVDYRDGDEFIATISLRVDGSMPAGRSYTIRPNSQVFSWLEPIPDNVTLDEYLAESWKYTHNFDSYTPYIVHVVPEPGDYALLGGLGLLGFAAYRRWGANRG
jgi:hypothetical protein